MVATPLMTAYEETGVERQLTAEKGAGLSIIVVSDYAAGEEKSWEDLRGSLRAWRDQEGDPPDEFILIESECWLHTEDRLWE